MPVLLETLMSKPLEILEDLQRKLSELIAQSPARDLEKNLRAALAQGFTKLDLVTREDFDVQREVLARTRARLVELEAKVAALEAERRTDAH